ncbi:hypothetical protein C7330_1406 [Pectobacterium versatile]|nr:hypothetical protein C7330_1406 [Pectobacterium versatile]
MNEERLNIVCQSYSALLMLFPPRLQGLPLSHIFYAN